MSIFGDFQREMKRQNGRGRCLHFDSGTQCSEVISAHSIQKSGQLSNIAEAGHVYRLSADISTLRKTNGLPEPKSIGLNKVSTFAGFCKTHDDELFKPIDIEPLKPTQEQIALYSYRCLCREYFVKENAVRLCKNLIDHPEHTTTSKDIFSSALKGHSLALKGLSHHKQAFEKSLKQKTFKDFEYTIFISHSKPDFALSGLLYPDNDFLGNHLQALGISSSNLNLITFFTAPTSNGWAYCFAWHSTSNPSCPQLIRSLATYAHLGGKLSDALLRFSISCCENHAFRISWWDKLTSEHKASISQRALLMCAPSIPVHPIYLNAGLENIANWEFENVLSSF